MGTISASTGGGEDIAFVEADAGCRAGEDGRPPDMAGATGGFGIDGGRWRGGSVTAMASTAADAVGSLAEGSGHDDGAAGTSTKMASAECTAIATVHAKTLDHEKGRAGKRGTPE
ncbi:MAG: hypothetical protein LW828_06780 [Xanthomonadaceae bacterium]|nr:hypothetical protein [Xanthomonadaceae bacterium]MCZ8317346.1 hypothetical protein [Silanimonas sp.]